LIIASVLPASVYGRTEFQDLPGSPGATAANDDELLSRIWKGVQAAQSKYLTGCGKITEVRTSKLLTRPMVFRGKFCASGTDRFTMEYYEPEPIRLVFNRDYLNVTTGKEVKTTEVIEVGHHVRRTQGYFSRENSIKNLKENFSISVRQSASTYEMRLMPRSRRFRQRVNYVVVGLGKDDFLLRTLEIDGTSGVRSTFKIDVESLNQRLDERLFSVYRPK
jgi:hypothetical protein